MEIGDDVHRGDPEVRQEPEQGRVISPARHVSQFANGDGAHRRPIALGQQLQPPDHLVGNVA